jgi:PAS domain S-box-containing protein
LAAIEPATSRWIGEAKTRHAVTLLSFTALMAVGSLLGIRVDWKAFATMLVWIGINFLMAPWASRPNTFEQRLRRYAITIVVDVVMLGFVYLFLDAAQWIGIVFFLHSALVASATLPRKWSFGIAGLIFVIYAALVMLAASGHSVVPSPIGLTLVKGNYAYAYGSIVGAMGLISILMLLQERLVETIRDAEQRYLLLVQSAPDMVMTFDAQGRFVDVNPATEEQTGYSWDEMKRLPNTSFFPPEDWPQIMAARQRNMAGETVSMDLRYVRKSGEVRWLQTTSAPFRKPGDRGAVLVIARDITEAKRKNDELRANDSRFRLILNALDLGFYTIDTAQRVTAMFGRWADDRAAEGTILIGKGPRELLPPDAAALHEAAHARALAGEDVTFAWTMTRPTDVLHLRTHLAPLHDEAGTIIGVAAVWSDETDATLADRERDMLRERVADAARIESLGKLVSGVAHELNNPLAAILNFTEDLLADPRQDEERIALEVIQSQALRSRTIVRDLLTFVRKGDRRPRKIEQPGPILETLMRAVRPGFATQGVAFNASVTDGETPMLIDRAGFEQVVTNLLTNAAQAAGSGGAVRLLARREGDSYVVMVDDNGAGINEEHFAKIFEPFFTTKPTGQGVGLGLSVSLGIVQAHGGSLSAENRKSATGGGARFTLRLPIAASAEAAAAPTVGPQITLDAARISLPARAPLVEPTTDPTPLPARRPTLLVIDDEESIRRALRRYFERRGWAVDEAPDGADALVKLLRRDAKVLYDVVLCDLKMPGVTGPDLFYRLQREAPQMMERLILSTGDVSAPDVADFLASVGVPVLEKPFELQTLEEIADRVRRETARR